MKLLLKILFIQFIGFNCLGQLNGNYTIGGTTPNYPTISAAVNALIAQGVNGPVVFNIRNGVYNEQATIPLITGASAVNTILFQGESQDSSLVQWQFNSEILAENFVCNLNGAQYISLRHMTISRSLSTSAGCRTVIFQNGAHNNSLSNCAVLGKSSSSAAEHEVVYSPTSIDTNNYIGHNRIVGGKYPIYFQGLNSTTFESGNVFEFNNTSGGLFGPYYFYEKNLIFHNNSATASIDIMYFNGKLQFSNNKINSTVDIHYHQTTTNDSVIVYGNMIISPYSSTAIHLRDCPNAFFYHNSLYGNMGSNVSTSGILRLNNSFARVANNIIHNSSSGFVVYLEYGADMVSDYNIYYSTYRFIKHNGTIHGSLVNWQTSTLQDDQSYFAATNFVSPTNLHIISDPLANANGFDLNVFADLDGDERPSSPDIGADEFQNAPNDAGVIAIQNMNGYMCPGVNPITVDIKNFGEDTLFNVNIGWSVNGVLQSPVSWSGVKPTDSIATSINLGNYNFLPNGTYNLKAWTYSPNGAIDTTNYNDTLIPATIYTMLQGNYTVGGISPDFSTLNACFQALILRGVCGPVIFNIRSGAYNEIINYDLNNVEGLSFVNTVTFQSEALSPDSVTHWFTANTLSNNWILLGNYWSHIYFKHMTFTRTGTGSGDEISVFNNAYDLKFIDCIFNTAGLFNGTALRINSGSIVQIDSCRFNRMNEAIYAELDSNYTVSNSIFDNCITRSIHIYNCNDSIIIRNNLIFNDTLTCPINYSMAGTGIALAFCNNLIEVDKNIIYGRFSDGMHITCLYDSVRPARFTNNFISLQGGSWNGGHGFYVDGAYNTIFKHNSIRVQDPDWDPVTPNIMVAFTFGANSRKNLTFANNLIQCDDDAYAFMLEANWPARFIDFDHNNIYFENPSSTNYVFSGAAWPNIWNANSSNKNPIFYGFDDLHVINPALALGIATWAGITDDVDSELREHPTVGADEGKFIPINTGGILLDIVNVCDSADIFMKVFNYGLDTIVKFDIEHSINGSQMPPTQWTGTLNPGDTTAWVFVSRFAQVELQNYAITASTHMPNDLVDSVALNDTVQTIYIGSNPELNLGNTAPFCFPDSLALTYIQNSSFTNLNWNTGQNTDTIYVQVPGTYTLSAVNQYGCPKIDSVTIIAGGFQTPNLTTDSLSVFSSETYGTNVWYYENVIQAGVVVDSVEIAGIGHYYVINTDTLGCPISSDTLYIGNYRDAGSITINKISTCDSTFITADIKNFGDEVLNSFDITLLLNGTVLTSVNWNGTLNSGDTIIGIQLGGFPTNYGSSDDIEVYTSNPNGQFDFNESNDTSSITQYLIQPILEIGDTLYSCKGESTHLTINNASDFSDILWSTTETTASIIIQNQGTYWVEAMDEFTCMHFDTVVLLVGGDVNPVITSSNDTLFSSVSEGIEWYLDGNLIQGETNDTLVATANGDYSLAYTDEFGCITLSGIITIAIIGLDEYDNNSFVLYPVPAQKSITIHTDQTIQTDVRITDLNGREVLIYKVETAGTNEVVIDISSLKPGSYLCHLNGVSKRFVRIN